MALVVWSSTPGIPNDTVQVFAWLWLGTVAWDVEAPARDDLGIGRVDLVLQGVGNPVAAMSSLHAGIAFLVAVHGVQRLRSPWRWTLLAYPALMSLALVYFAEHHVVDIVAGAALALAVAAAAEVWERHASGGDRAGTVRA